MKTYRTKREGQVLLVCGKCERKLDGGLKIGKGLKKLAKRDVSPISFHVIRVGCLKLCPKGGVTVCTREGLRKTPVEMGIVWGKPELQELYDGGREGFVLPDEPTS